MLTNKTILIISPQGWKHIFISKHHYALTLAEMGNKVFFLNPINSEVTYKKTSITIHQSEESENLYFINHALFFPYKLKFHAIGLFHWLVNFHLKKILKKIGTPLDIVWSFDLSNYFPLKMLPATYKIFHPVDEPSNTTALDSAKGADIILAVTKEILGKYKHHKIPGFVINHGISTSFFKKGTLISSSPHGQIRIGLSGNHTRPDIDWPILYTIVEQNPTVVFEFWGPFEIEILNSNKNLSCITQSKYFIDKLKKTSNVFFHGSVSTSKLVNELNRMDGFLICYDILKDQSKGTNYHKILEYLSTGKVVISNNVTAYKNHIGLIYMSNERTNNKSLPLLFKSIVGNLAVYNNLEMQRKRISFGENNTYLKQVNRIEQHLMELERF